MVAGVLIDTMQAPELPAFQHHVCPALCKPDAALLHHQRELMTT